MAKIVQKKVFQGPDGKWITEDSEIDESELSEAEQTQLQRVKAMAEVRPGEIVMGLAKFNAGVVEFEREDYLTDL